MFFEGVNNITGNVTEQDSENGNSFFHIFMQEWSWKKRQIKSHASEDIVTIYKKNRLSQNCYEYTCWSLVEIFKKFEIVKARFRKLLE
jgi:hypothetical protein